MALTAGRSPAISLAGLCDRQLLGALQHQRPQPPQKGTSRSALRRRQLQATSGGSKQVRTVAHADSRSSSSQQDEEAQLRFDDRDGSAVPSGEQTAAANGASAITLHYSSGWRQPTMLYSLQGADWVRCTLEPVASSAQWKSATFRLNGTTAAPGQPDPPLLEFVITEGESWDKPIDGTNYVINERGRFTLRDGTVAAVDGEPVLVVSDLDDTMIGDDEATAVFKRFWDTMAVPRGSRLIYNTGRALHKCISLFEEKRGVLPPPDYLITSVGTKVYNCVDGEWVVDADHVAMLDYAWDLDIVREATYAALAAVGRDNMHFRPPDEQNEHKVTCGVSVAALDRGVLEQLDKTLRRDGVKARLITSGTGDWRFLDIVPLTAGKHEAMDYLRRKLGFSYESTVAAGDSGNDRAMFEGRNRGIIVGNSQPDLLDWLAAQRQQGVNDGRLVLTGKARARGILEGLAHFGLI